MSRESMFKIATTAATTLIIGVLLSHTAVADGHGAEDPDAAKLKEYMGVANLVDGLRVYNRQQEALLADQQAERAVHSAPSRPLPLLKDTGLGSYRCSTNCWGT